MEKIDNIKNNDLEIDLQGLATYTRSWESLNSIIVYGYDINIPDEPEDKDCVNYGLSIHDQIFRRTFIPKDLKYWKQKEKEAFIHQEYHRRKNGLWYFIKGKKTYLTGLAYYFFNYWKIQTGKPLLFRMSDLDFFYIWMHVVLTPNIYGLVVFKCRRIGDTEKALCMMYEYASRVRNTINGMQDCRNETEIFNTYLRLTFAHENMIWFMKPINRGTTNPKANLELKMPEERVSMKGIQVKANKTSSLGEVEFEFDALGSEINYYVSTPEASDGKRLGRYYVDEFSKPKKLNPLSAWKYAKKTLVDQIYETISGKALFTSTVEEEENAKNADKSSRYVEIAETMWEEADPNILNDSGETTSGMIRIVRGALERGIPDRWGFTDKVRLLAKIESDKRHLIEQKKWTKLKEYCRQNCVDLQDIFMSMDGDSSFNIENLIQREHRLKYDIKPQKYVRGNFEWLDGKKFGDVYFAPNSNGRWCVSGHPKDFGCQQNAKNEYALNNKPKNIHAFCCGIDPVSLKDVLDKDPSKSGLVVKAKFNALIDGDKFDDEGNPENAGEHFITNRYVCSYLYRHPEPTDNYEDWLKTLIYYGTDFLIEKNHSAGFETYLELNRYSGYYMGAANIKNYKGQKETFGMSANDKTIEHYFSLIATQTNLWYNTIDLPDVITQWKSMNWDNRGKRDLGVAAGICEVASQREIATPKERDKEAIIHFTELYV